MFKKQPEKDFKIWRNFDYALRGDSMSVKPVFESLSRLRISSA